jgi:hypothetical protein
MGDKKVKIIHSASVYGEIIRGTMGKDSTLFMLEKLFDKNLSLGYWNGFNKGKLKTLIDELQEVYDNMEDEKKEGEET